MKKLFIILLSIGAFLQSCTNQKKEISQEKLSLKMGLTKSFVGNVENIKENHKYSTRHIALLAKAFGFLNISELMNFPTPKYDKIKVTVIFACNIKTFLNQVES